MNKLKRYVGTFDLRTAKLITDRAITFLKSQDWPPKSQLPTSKIAPHSKNAIPATLTFHAKTWAALRSSPEVAKKIAQISVLLDNVIEHTAHSNLPEDERLLTEIERNQLIAILETALNLLKGPLVKKGLFDRAGDILKRGAKKAAETQTGGFWEALWARKRTTAPLDSLPFLVAFLRGTIEPTKFRLPANV